jgi:dTDP-4-dehydrorhamnose 3,5-epimerase-like enzyme
MEQLSEDNHKCFTTTGFAHGFVALRTLWFWVYGGGNKYNKESEEINIRMILIWIYMGYWFPFISKRTVGPIIKDIDPSDLFLIA